MKKMIKKTENHRSEYIKQKMGQSSLNKTLEKILYGRPKRILLRFLRLNDPSLPNIYGTSLRIKNWMQIQYVQKWHVLPRMEKPIKCNSIILILFLPWDTAQTQEKRLPFVNGLQKF